MELCLYCHIGSVELQKVVFVQRQGHNTAVVDWLPAMVCGNCGQKSYDSRALEHLQHLLLSPEWRKSSARPTRPGSR